jgi:hypothetical protein
MSNSSSSTHNRADHNRVSASRVGGHSITTSDRAARRRARCPAGPLSSAGRRHEQLRTHPSKIHHTGPQLVRDRLAQRAQRPLQPGRTLITQQVSGLGRCDGRRYVRCRPPGARSGHMWQPRQGRRAGRVREHRRWGRGVQKLQQHLGTQIMQPLPADAVLVQTRCSSASRCKASPTRSADLPTTAGSASEATSTPRAWDLRPRLRWCPRTLRGSGRGTVGRAGNSWGRMHPVPHVLLVGVLFQAVADGTASADASGGCPR